MPQSTVLVIDDRADVRMSARFCLEDNGYQVLESDSPTQAKSLLTGQSVDLLLLDMNFSRDTTSGTEGLEFLRWLDKSEHECAVVAMTAWSNVPLAVEAMQLGAGDFIEKPWKNPRLLQIVAQQLQLRGLRQQNRQLRQRLQQQTTEHDSYQWRSPGMCALLEQLGRVAQSNVAILLTGENGTGKSQLAAYIHQQSAVAGGEFIAVNMGAISEQLFESDMFGHKKGAFTDAKEQRIGRFALADGGSLFLDEIANIPLSQQAKLLRVLESGEFEPLGSSQTQRSQARIISATNGDISALIQVGQFREDLFYRLNTVSFEVPPLRARQEDIVPFARYLLAQLAAKYQKGVLTFSHCAEQQLQHYDWPGNLRELSHVLERAVLLAGAAQLSAADLPLQIQVPTASPGGLPLMPLQQAERELIRLALQQSQQHIPRAAALLGLSKAAMYRRLEKYPDLAPR